ncbi:hypothetical protein C8J56DRAFT_1050873 [Mycena floridula]|nr:hypothetical protein C8J56DRAFT_1050873 [Mycena floridula]
MPRILHLCYFWPNTPCIHHSIPTSEPLNDPSKESCPAFSSAAFQTIIQKIVTERRIMRQEAIQDLTTDWEQSRAERVAAFKVENPDLPEEPELATNNQKIPKVNATLAVPTVHDARPSSYAIDKLEKYGNRAPFGGAVDADGLFKTDLIKIYN